ncbi:hypothetical protein [Enterovibrio norvegicus]|uniref:hypothetical protein n=1 Tax=Enterovibrio norvegicus TaxID=188144 RepID=UPI00352D078E
MDPTLTEATSFIWGLPESVVLTLIKSISTIIATLIPSLIGAIVSYKYVSKKKLAKDLDTAIEDILYLSEVEKVHCAKHIENGSNTNKRNTVRREVRESTNLKWSGKFTPSSIETKKVKLAQII